MDEIIFLRFSYSAQIEKSLLNFTVQLAKHQVYQVIQILTFFASDVYRERFFHNKCFSLFVHGGFFRNKCFSLFIQGGFFRNKCFSLFIQGGFFRNKCFSLFVQGGFFRNKCFSLFIQGGFFRNKCFNLFVQRGFLLLPVIVLCGIKFLKMFIIFSLKIETCLFTSRLERLSSQIIQWLV